MSGAEGGAGGRESPTAMFLGAEAARGGPFALLGLRAGALDDEQILRARDQRMREIDVHRLAETPEADEVRLSLYAAAAQLLNPVIRAQLAESWGGPPAGVQSGAAQPARPPGSRVNPLEQDAILALAMFGGWNRKSLRRIASIAHARGLSSQDVAQTLRRIGRQRRPMQGARVAIPASTGAKAPLAPVFGAPPPQVSLLDPLPEQIDPAQRLLKVALIVAAVAVTTLVVLFGGVYAIMAVDRAESGRVAQHDGATGAPPEPARVRREANRPGRTPASQRRLPEPDALGDPALVVHELEGARRGLELTPYESTRRFAQAVRLLSGSWAGFSPEELELANDSVEVFLESLVRPDVSRLALDAVGAGVVSLGEPGTPVEGDEVWSGVWSAGMLAQIQRNPVLGASMRGQIDRLRRRITPDGARGSGFRVGAAIGVRVIGDRLSADGASLRTWQRWIETVDAVSREDEALRTDLLSGALESLLAPAQMGVSRQGGAIREIALAMSWRQNAGARRWLVMVLGRRGVDQAALAGLVEAVVSESGASGLDATMTLSPNATGRERAALSERLTEAWGLGRDERADSFSQALGEVVRAAIRERSIAPNPAARLAPAVRLAYANAGAALARDERFEDASRALGLATAFGLDRGATPSADPFDAPGDGSWAVRLENSGDSPEDRLRALDRLGKRMSSRIGPVDAEVLLSLALRGTPRSVRERAQLVAARFVASPAMVNAMLERVDDLPRSAQVIGLVELMTTRPIDTGAGDGSWRVEARRALLETLIEVVAREGADGDVDTLSAELENAYAMALGDVVSEDSGHAQNPLTDSARTLALRYRREASRLGGAPGLGIDPPEIERRRRSRLALSETPIHRFLSEQIALCESLALLVAGERGGISGEINGVLSDLARELREATHVLDQVSTTELAIARLWLIREGVSP